MSAPYQAHSETSKAAAESIERDLTRQQLEILRIFARFPTPLSDNDLIQYVIDQGLRVSVNGVRARRIELVKMGRLVPYGTKRGASGRLAVTYVIP